MAKGRWWVTIRRIGDGVDRDVRSIYAPTLAAAEGKAQALLRVARLVKHDGTRWDRWEVRTSAGPHGLPALLAYGDHLRTTYTARDHGWRD